MHTSYFLRAPIIYFYPHLFFHNEFLKVRMSVFQPTSSSSDNSEEVEDSTILYLRYTAIFGLLVNPTQYRSIIKKLFYKNNVQITKNQQKLKKPPSTAMQVSNLCLEETWHLVFSKRLLTHVNRTCFEWTRDWHLSCVGCYETSCRYV